MQKSIKNISKFKNSRKLVTFNFLEISKMRILKLVWIVLNMTKSQSVQCDV